MSGVGLRLLVRAPDELTELLAATPVLHAAASDPRFRGTRLLVPRGLAPFLEDAPWQDRIVTFADAKEERVRYREIEPAAALLLATSFEAARIAWRARVPVRAGVAGARRRWLLTHACLPPVRRRRPAPVPTANLLRDAAGLVGLHPASMAPRLWVRQELREVLAAELERHGLGGGAPLLVCAPGASPWPAERFAAVAAHLHSSLGWPTVVVGGGDGESRAQAVIQACRHPVVELPLDPLDPGRLKALVRGARLVLAGDPGVSWVAAAYGAPCVAVTDPAAAQAAPAALEHARRLPGELWRGPGDLSAAEAIEACEGLLVRSGGVS